MFTSIHVIQSEGLGPYVLVPNNCLQPISRLLSQAVLIPGESYQALFPNARDPKQATENPELLFTGLHTSLICNKFCFSRDDCPLPQKNHENTITNGPQFNNAIYTILPTYASSEKGNGIVSSKKLTISNKCPLSPSTLSESLVMVIPSDTDTTLKPEGEIISGYTDTKEDPLVSIGAMLTGAFFRLDKQPQGCASCPEVCSLNPRLRAMHFPK